MFSGLLGFRVWSGMDRGGRKSFRIYSFINFLVENLFY